jgi:phage tail sheath protein FI
MAELTFKSPGVSTREIDLSGPTQSGPSGIPAGVIGTAKQGRAFVPITMATFADFIAEFGDVETNLFGPLAMRQWLGYANSGTYVRTLGIGDGKKRSTTGVVTNAGFTAGSQTVQANGVVGANTYAGITTTNAGALGRTHFLAVIMSQSNGSNVFSNAGLDPVIPILRGVLLAPSGVNLALSSSRAAVTNNLPLGGPSKSNFAAAFEFGTAATKDAGSTLGAVNIAAGRQEFVMLQNGHSHTDSYPTIVTASFDPVAPNYFANVFNTDPTKTEQAGHCLYTHFDVTTGIAAVTGSTKMAAAYAASFDGVKEGTALKMEDIAFLTTGSLARATGNTTKPDFESFTDRFRTAKFPTIISQEFGGQNKDLFTMHCLDDGAVGSSRVKVSIENIIKSNNTNNKYGTFDMLVRDFNDTDAEPLVLERFVKLSLDPNSERYITRVIGDYNIFYDFDKRVGGQKLVVEGSYPNASNYVRVSPSTEMERGNIPATSLPVGFRGIPHIVSSGSAIFGGPEPGTLVALKADVHAQMVQPPIPMRQTVAQGQSPRKRINTSLYWGIQAEKRLSVAEPNSSTIVDPSISSYGAYFPNYRLDQQAVMADSSFGVADVTGTILDCDRFNNNKFSLEKIQVITTSADKADAAQWAAATYRRDGSSTATLTDIDGTSSSSTRLLNVSKDFGLSTARPFLKFTMTAQGGFDGLDIFNDARTKMKSEAVRREMTYTDQGLTAGPTVAAYRKALDVMSERSDVDIQLLAIPGIRHSGVTDYAITTVEERFDALYIMDLEVKDTLGNIVSGSDQEVSVTNTAADFNSRNLDSSFAAAYFPDVVMIDPSSGAASSAPPSVAVIGAFGLNDSVAFPWYAPAGFTRGALKNVTETQVKLNRSNLDTLYEADINPITSFPQSKEVVVFGQKTLLAAQSALDRVNVRRLLIDIRRQVRKIGDTFLFEPNRESTLARFSAAVTPVLTRIQAQQGLERFKVQIDTTTTTQADVENNTVRGKVFLQPVRSVEFISLDFVVTNAGLDI